MWDATDSPGRCLYTAARLVIGDGSTRRDAGVLVDGPRIVAIGAAREFGGVAAVRRDFAGGTILPGLIDAHVHLALDGGADPMGDLVRAGQGEPAAGMAARAGDLLAAGVTTARDLGAPGLSGRVIRDAIAAGAVAGPRLLTALRPLTVPGGHCWFMGGVCGSADELRAAVRRHAAEGADLIKVLATGGMTTPDFPAWRPQFTTAEVRAVVAEARAHGLPVAAHAHGVDGIRSAVEAGVDTLEHCTWQTEDGRGGYDPALADKIAAAGIAVCGTFNPGLLRDPSWVERRRAVVTDMRERGVRFFAGSDAGVVRTPHRAYAEGLAAMAAYGFPAQEVLRAATGWAADAIGLTGAAGVLAAGRIADIVVVDGDPVTDLRVLGRPRLVVRAGREAAGVDGPGVPAANGAVYEVPA